MWKLKKQHPSLSLRHFLKIEAGKINTPTRRTTAGPKNTFQPLNRRIFVDINHSSMCTHMLEWLSGKKANKMRGAKEIQPT